MKYSTTTGSVMLMVVILMSITLALCARMWHTTGYLVDIAIQKQVHTQQYWATAGILNCGIAVCRDHFDIMQQRIKEQGGVISTTLHSLSFSAPCTKDLVPYLTFGAYSKNSIAVTAALQNKQQRVVVAQSCIVERRRGNDQLLAYHVCNWQERHAQKQSAAC